MRWPKMWNDREGPGVDKDAPKKTGLALFGQIVVREAWELFKLNLLIVLASLPVVTVFAAHAAGTRIAAAMIRDENVYLWRDFWGAFRELFGRATLAGLLVLVLFGAAAYSTWIWTQMAANVPLAAAPLTVSAAVTLFVVMIAVNLFALVATTGLPLAEAFKIAFVAALARPLPVLAGIGFVVALWLVHILFYPVSVFMPAVMNFSLGVLALTFSVFRTLSEPLVRKPGVRTS
jgi:uncharacterized membrane protein YesL